MNRRVVITGLGTINPLGKSLPEFERNLRAGISGLTFRPELESAGFRCRAAGYTQQVDDQLAQLFSPDQLADMDGMNRLGTLAAWMAWVDAGLEPGPIDYDSGAILGSDAPAAEVVLAKLPLIDRGKVRRIGGRYAEQTMICGPAARTAALLGLGNRTSHINTTSATGLTAIVDGMRHVQHGLAERMVCGAVQSPSILSWASLDSMKVTNRNWDPPAEASRPLSKRACGLVPGSGAGAVVIESLESAQDRGAQIYAEVIGACTNCGAGRDGGTLTAPSIDGIRHCINEAMREASIDFNEIDLINGHLTGTMADAREAGIWIELAEKDRASLPVIHSTKSLMGHPLAAAGAIETVACCLMMQGGFIHPSLNCDDLIEEMQPHEASVPHQTLEADVRTVIKSSLGFGDVNAVAVFHRWDN